MTPADVEPVAAAFIRENWGDRRLNLEFVTRHAETHPFIAEADGRIVGTGVLSVNGSVGWIGTIWVETAWRRQGVGMALTEATVDAAEAAGCRTLLLVATEAGRPLYEKIGFEVQTSYRILEAPGLGDGRVDRRIRPYEAADLSAMAELSTAATGEDRMHLLAAFASPETAHLPCGRRRGIGRFRGPCAVGRRLHDRAAAGGRRGDPARPSRGPRSAAQDPGRTPRREPGRARALARDRLDESWSAPRLIRGEPLRWQPEAIWGQFNHAVG